jgi:pyruvate formate lyase activating enzyme
MGMDAQSCLVIDISRGTTHDGPGLRTTVFFKGCPLNCLWCQNPEGIKAGQEIWWEERKCIHCLSCQAACRLGAVHDDVGGIHIGAAVCDLCGACVEACPAQGMTFTGQAWTLDALLHEVLKDKDYYEAFGGGVTASGGEPLRQHPFVSAFFQRLKAAGVNTALDTCGLASWESLQATLPYVDHVLYDIKLLDPALHTRYTGHNNDVILSNLRFIADTIRQARREREMRLWIRTPLIPDTTATPENLAAISVFINEHLRDVVERWELCAFNSVCKRKYHKMGRPWAYERHELMGQGTIDTLRDAALSAGFPAERLIVSGLIAKERVGGDV